MTGLQIAMAIVLILVSLALIIVVLIQKDRQANANAVTGGSDSSFFDKTKGHQKDAALSNATKVLGVLLVLVAIATLAITLFL